MVAVFRQSIKLKNIFATRTKKNISSHVRYPFLNCFSQNCKNKRHFVFQVYSAKVCFYQFDIHQILEEKKNNLTFSILCTCVKSCVVPSIPKKTWGNYQQWNISIYYLITFLTFAENSFFKLAFLTFRGISNEYS